LYLQRATRRFLVSFAFGEAIVGLVIVSCADIVATCLLAVKRADHPYRGGVLKILPCSAWPLFLSPLFNKQKNDPMDLEIVNIFGRIVFNEY
jgi:hypothetical protein